MSETAHGDSGFATTILTSKTPQQAANILPNSLDSTTKLIDEKLIDWFSKYTSAIKGHNQVLQKLYEEGSHFFTEEQSFGEYGNFPRIWNCLLSSLQVEHANNEILYKNLKLDVLGPLKDVVDKDVRLSELLINSQELQEISSKLAHNDSNAEIEWNYKAPQSFANLENFKAFEIQLLFDIVLNFFQFHSTRLTKDSENNVNSTNYLLNNFKLSNELNHYLEYVVSTNFKASKENGFVKQQQDLQKKQQQSFSKQNKRLSTFHKPDNQSIVSGGSNTTATKRSSKIKSKVGSIFGRKSKADKKAFAADTIPETESIHTTTSSQLPAVGVYSQGQDLNRTSSISRNNSIRRPSSIDVYGNPQSSQPGRSQSQQYAKNGQPESRQSDVSALNSNREATTASSANQSFPSPKYYTNPTGPTQTTAPISSSSVPLVANKPAQVQAPVQTQAPAPAVSQAQQQAPVQAQTPVRSQGPMNSESVPYDSPNVVPYDRSDSSSDEDGPEDVSGNGRRLSMLQRHDLAPTEEPSPFKEINQPPARPPKEQSYLEQPQGALASLNGATSERLTADPRLGLPRSRQSSSGLYSFETGDDKKPIETSPRQANAFETGQDLPEPQIVDTSPAKASQGVAPPPPPSRKVVHHEEEVPVASQPPRNRKDIQSQIFHNLPNARESFIQPSNGFGGLNSPTTLISQNTGNSLLKNNDVFKHFDSRSAEHTGLNSSVAEVANVTFKDGKLSKAQIIGEIAFNYNTPDGSAPAGPITLSIPSKFDKTIVNNTFINQVSEEQFQVDASSILSKTLGGLKYLTKLSESQVPILVQHVWKYEPHQASLMINLKLNPAIHGKVIFNNLVVSVALNLDVKTTSASSKPTGSFNKDKNRITWRYNSPLVLSESVTEERLIARFITQGVASEHDSGVQLKFQVQDPYVQNTVIYDGTGSEIPVVRNLISGNYSGHTV